MKFCVCEGFELNRVLTCFVNQEILLLLIVFNIYYVQIQQVLDDLYFEIGTSPRSWRYSSEYVGPQFLVS